MRAKPPYGSRLNLANPLSVGMDLIVLPDWGRDPLYGATLTRTGAPTIGGSSWGQSLATTAGSQYVTAYWPKRKYDARTLLIVADFGAWTQYASPHTSGYAESLVYNSAAPQFQWNVHGASWNTTHTLIGTPTWSQTLISRRKAIVVLTWNRLGDGYARAYVDGILASTGASEITTVSDRTQTSASTAIAIGAAKTQSMGNLALAAFTHWARALSQSEIEDLTANPWAMFGSRRLVSMYVPSGGGAFTQALSVGATGTASYSRGLWMVRSVESAVAATSTRQVGLIHAASASVSAAVARLISLAKTATSSGSAVLDKGLAFLRSLSAGTTGSASLSVARQWLYELAASASGAATLAREIAMQRLASAEALASYAREIALRLAAESSVAAGVVRQIERALNASASVVAALTATIRAAMARLPKLFGLTRAAGSLASTTAPSIAAAAETSAIDNPSSTTGFLEV